MEKPLNLPRTDRYGGSISNLVEPLESLGDSPNIRIFYEHSNKKAKNVNKPTLRACPIADPFQFSKYRVPLSELDEKVLRENVRN